MSTSSTSISNTIRIHLHQLLITRLRLISAIRKNQLPSHHHLQIHFIILFVPLNIIVQLKIIWLQWINNFFTKFPEIRMIAGVFKTKDASAWTATRAEKGGKWSCFCPTTSLQIVLCSAYYVGQTSPWWALAIWERWLAMTSMKSEASGVLHVGHTTVGFVEATCWGMPDCFTAEKRKE